MGCFDYLDLDHCHKYHDFAGWQGFVMIGTKLIVTGFFAYQCVETTKSCDKKLKKFYDNLFTTGSMYFFSVPAAIFCSYVQEPYERQIIFLGVSQACMFLSVMRLFYILSAQERGYAKPGL